MTAQAATSVQTFRAPSTVAEAIAAKTELGSDAVFLAGGTDLGVQLRRRLLQPAHLISLAGVPELTTIGQDGDVVIVGSAVTHRSIETSHLFSGSLEALQEACHTVGSVQTRTVGTIGGNLCNASPAADVPPILLAFGASVVVEGPAGPRTMSLEDFVVGYRETALGPDELLTAVRIPVPAGTTGSAFVKLGRRRAMEISIACVGARIDLASDGTIARAGIGLGSVAPITVRARAAEKVLTGARPGRSIFAAAAAATLDVCDPIDDVRATAEYRRAMTPVLVGRALASAVSRANGET